MNIYAPSYKRAKGVKTHRIIKDIIYCVHEFEADDYKKLGYNVEFMPDSVKGNIARVRNYMLDNYIGDKGLIVDDDLEAVKRWNIKEGKPKQETINNITEWIEQGFNMSNTVSASFMGFLNNELRFDERLPLKDDYDYCLQNLNKYRKILRFNYACLVKKDHGNLGGCADYRTMSREKDQLKLMQKKWGSKIVKLDTTQRGKKKKNFDLNPIIKAPIKGI